MSDQLSFLEERAPGRPTDGLFLAAFPPAHPACAFCEAGRQLKSEHRLRGKPHAADRLHLSLISLGEHIELPQRIVDMAREAAATIAFAPIELSFNRVESFFGKPGSYPLVVRCGDGLAPLTAFHRALAIAMKKAGLGKWLKPLDAPHVTLMYADRRIDAQIIEPIRWIVNEFILVHSLLGKTVYKSLGHWPLRG